MESARNLPIRSLSCSRRFARASRSRPRIPRASWCHPLTRRTEAACQNGTTRLPEWGHLPEWCHPSVRSAAKPDSAAKMAPTACQTGATPQHASQLVPPAGSSPADSAGKLNTGKLGPPPNPLGPESGPPVSSSRQFLSDCQNSATRRFGAKMVPPVSSESCQTGATPRCKLGATPQTGMRKWRRRAGPVRPELLPSARSCRLRGLTHCR